MAAPTWSAPGDQPAKVGVEELGLPQGLLADLPLPGAAQVVGVVDLDADGRDERDREDQQDPYRQIHRKFNAAPGARSASREAVARA